MQKVVCAALMGLNNPMHPSSDWAPAPAPGLGLDEVLEETGPYRVKGAHEEQGVLLRAMSNKWKGKVTA